MIKRTKLAAAISAVCSVMATQAQAQDAQLEEVVVTGIRGSMQMAMDVKRDSSGVVDAISAEDMGKFPDTNLAESLQRITGVSIDRVEGEGSEVTVRGFGGGFNLVTLNGRQLPAANVQTIGSDNLNAVGDSRSFDFSNLASEGVSGLQVYKTGRANAPSGGIGATINISTIKPLQAGDQFTLGGKVVNDTGRSGVTPEFSGLASWANDDDTFGVSLFASVQERESSFRHSDPGTLVWGAYNPDNPNFAQATMVNEPEAGELAGFPQSFSVTAGTTNRKRTNGMLTMQFAPSDKLLITADALYAANELDSHQVGDSIWFARQFTYIEWDDDPIVKTPILMAELYTGDPNALGKDNAHALRDLATKDEMINFGLNFEYEYSDKLRLFADIASATAKSGGNGPNGMNIIRANVSGGTTAWQAAYFGGDVPQAEFHTQDVFGNNNSEYDVPDVGSQVFQQNLSTMKMDIDQFKLGGSWDSGNNITVDFGVGYIDTQMEQDSTSYSDTLGGWGVGNTGDLPDGAISQTCSTCEFTDQTFTGVPGAAELAAADGITNYSPTIVGAVSFDTSAWALSQAMSGNALYPDYDANNPTVSGFDDNTIDETLYSSYLQATMDGEIGDMPMQTVVGLRYEVTDVQSSTNQLALEQYIWTSDNDFDEDFGEGISNVSEKYSYHNLLPSIDFSIDITDEIKARASFSKTLARPRYNYMFVKTDTNNPETLTYLGGTATATKGTATLDPLESNNFDLSVEYYYDDANYASIGYFQKAVSNFVGTEQVDFAFFGIRDQTTGEPGTLSGDAIAALEGLNVTPTEESIFTMAAILDNPDAYPGGAAEFLTADPLQVFTDYDVESRGSDPLMVFSTQQPVNNKTANIDGIEVAWQHFFGETGFGLQANATFVNGDIGYDVAGAPNVDQFALEGLSDSANLILIYENDIFGARLAYNWRDQFLSDTNVSRRLPRFVDEYEQLDLNVSWNVNDALTLSLDGLNLTEENTSSHGRSSRNVWTINEADARWVLSARYTF